jgi:hypothetical protein
MSDVSELYRESIAQLEALSADFKISDEAREQANAQIAALRDKAQDAALDDLAARTDNLNALAANLSSVLDKTTGGGGPLQALVERVKRTLGA